MPSSDPVRLVVADDEPDMLSLLAEHFRSQGFEVHEASDGDAAVDLVSEVRPHAVLLDVMMPGQSGWEVCRHIKASPELKNTPVVMLTGIGETLNDMTSPLFGADAYFNKQDFDFGELGLTLRRVLEEHGTNVPAAKKPAAKKPAAKKTAAKKPAAKKTAAKKTAAKKPAAKKPAAKKPAAKKRASRKGASSST